MSQANASPLPRSAPPAPAPVPALGTRILTRAEVARLLTLEDCIVAVEQALRAHAEGRSVPPGVLSAHVDGGAFHVKTAGLAAGRPCFAAKLNGNFNANRERFGLPRIQGLIVLCDAENGYPLAVMDSTYVTVVRTAAATAVAARYLAREDAATLTVCGCGLQGRAHLEAIRSVRPIGTVYLYDLDPAAAERLAAELSGREGLALIPTRDLAGAVRRSDLCVTCTPSRSPLLAPGDLRPGAFVAAVGADSEEKQELDPHLLAQSKVVVDHLEQCATIGELHHALDRGLLSRADVHAELHEVVAGRRPGRTVADETFIYDSTGVALQDVAAAALVFERAVADDAGATIRLLDEPSGARPEPPRGGPR